MESREIAAQRTVADARARDAYLRRCKVRVQGTWRLKQMRRTLIWLPLSSACMHSFPAVALQ